MHCMVQHTFNLYIVPFSEYEQDLSMKTEVTKHLNQVNAVVINLDSLCSYEIPVNSWNSWSSFIFPVSTPNSCLKPRVHSWLVTSVNPIKSCSIVCFRTSQKLYYTKMLKFSAVLYSVSVHRTKLQISLNSNLNGPIWLSLVPAYVHLLIIVCVNQDKQTYS